MEPALLMIIAAGLIFFGSKARAATAPATRQDTEPEGPPAPEGMDTNINVTMLASTLWAETSGRGKHSDRELTGIAFVAINRATGPYSLRDVLRPPGRSAYGVWNGSTTFRERWEGAHGRTGYERCVSIATQALDGSVPNPIGNRALFFHPTGLPRPRDGECGSRRIELETKVGPRCAPVWSTRNPLTIGEAVFCGNA